MQALFALLGDKAWWMPGWLDPLLPNLDIEGKELTGGQPAGRHLPNQRPLPQPHPTDRGPTATEGGGAGEQWNSSPAPPPR